ncbi:hypothetical protein [Rickettsia endosymbiont of Rhinocyllus conicus]|uniref:beta strand repeat-containing protein n=1 Tax=Rickettsia endosymbiont of Rhinocyllus conicus TaxID=3066252 RepID=UPI0031333B45
MSSQKNNIKDFVKKALVSTSMAATMLTAESAFGTSTLINRDVTGSTADLNSGAGLDAGAPLLPGQMLTVTIQSNINVNTPTVNGTYLSASGTVMTFTNPNTTIDAIQSSNGNPNALSMVITPGVHVTLTGVGYPADPDAKDASGNSNPFAGTATNQSDIASIDFQNGNGIIEMNAKTSGLMDFATGTTPTIIANAADATTIIGAGTTIQVKDKTWTSMGTIDIAPALTATIGTGYKYINGLTGDVNVYPVGQTFIFRGQTSSVDFSNESSQSYAFVSGKPIAPITDNSGTITDSYGAAAFHVSTSETTIAVNIGLSNKQRLNTFITDGKNITTITGTIFAQTIGINQNPSDMPAGTTQLKWQTPIDTGAGGVIKFGSSSISEFQAAITSNMDFNGTGATAIIDSEVNITGNIINSVAGGTQNLNFAGDNTVTGSVGGNVTGSNPIYALNIQGDNNTLVDLQGDVTVENFNFTSDGMADVGGTLTAISGVNFNNQKGTLIFDGTGGSYVFSSPVISQSAGGITVATNLTVTDPSIADIGVTQIGSTTLPGALTYAINQPNLTLLANGSKLTFAQANSSLTFDAPTQQTVAFGDSIDGFTDGTSNMVLNGTQPLTIQGTTNDKTIGATKKFNNLNVIGNVTASGGASLINIGGFTSLTIAGNSNLTDQGVTSSNIASIIIGDSSGASGYILTPTENFNLASDGLKFGNTNSLLTIQSNGDVTANLNGDLDPGISGGGAISLNSTGGTLTITNANNLGIAGSGNLLNTMEFKGTGNITVNPTINTANPITTLLDGQLILGNVNTSINFAAATNLTVNNVIGTTDFKGQTGIVNINNNGIVGIVTSSIAGTPAGTVNFVGAGTSTAITNVTAVNFQGAGLVTLTSPSDAGNFTVTASGVQINTADAPANLTTPTTGIVAAGDGAVFATINGNASVNTGSITGSISKDATITATGQITGNTGGNASVGVNGQIIGNIGGTATYTGAGTINTTTIGGQTDFAGNEGKLNVNDGGNLGIITSSIVGTPAGTVNFAGAGTTTAITNVTAVNFNGAGTVNITSPSGPSTFTVNNADAQVNTAASPAALTGTVAAGDGAVFATITGPASVNAGSITGSINGDATITATGQITGNVDGNATVNAGQLTGDVTGNTTVTTGQMTGNTGGNASVGVNGQITGNIGGTATYTGAGTITATTIGGQTDLAGFAGVLNVNANGTVGNVISSNGVVGEAMLGDSVTTGDIINVATVNFAGAGTINSIQNAGAVNFNGPGLVTLTNASSAGTFTIAQGGTVVNDGNGVTGDVVAGDGEFNSNIDGNASVNDGTITGGVSQNATITGDGQINGSVGGNAAVNAGVIAKVKGTTKLHEKGTREFGVT